MQRSAKLLEWKLGLPSFIRVAQMTRTNLFFLLSWFKMYNNLCEYNFR